jgi:tyrosine-protein kinase Etk/Wzc
MNKSAPPPALPYQNNDGIDLATYLGVLFDNRWLIIKVTLLAILVGMGVAFTATPIYQANMVLQVEDAPAKNPLGLSDLSGMFESKAAAASEMEILRTRMIVSHAVDTLKLNVTAVPKYFPRIGRWIASHNNQLSTPGLFGYGGYVWGAESIGLSTFNVPEAFHGMSFTLTAQGNGHFRLSLPGQGIDVTGDTGELLTVGTPEGPIELKVERLAAKPGAEFVLTYGSRLGAIRKLQSSLQTTEAGRLTGIINVSLQGANPKLTASILNEIGQQYLSQNMQRKSEEAEKTLAFLSKQLPELKQQLEQSEAKYNQFRNINSSVNLGEEASATLQQSVAAQAKLIVAKQKRDALLFEATPEHPAVKALDNDIRAINEELNGIASRVKKLPSVEQDMLRLSRDVKVNTDLYTALLNSSQQLRLVKAGKVGSTRLLDPAVIPESPVSPNRLLIMGIALTAGLVSGVVLAFFRKSLSGGVDDAEEIERLLGMPVYATIPHSHNQQLLQQRARSKSQQLPMLARVNPGDIAVESLRSLRTTLQSSMLGAKNNMILVTGPTSKMGKSFVAANLASVLAANGKRVVLVDADMRKGHLHQYFNLGKKNGLSELIAGTADQAHSIHRNVLPDVDLISAGTSPAHPSDMLLDANFSKLLKALSTQYDYVLIDSPPVLAVSDSLAVASQVGTVFLVTRAGETTAAEIKESMKRIDKVTAALTCVILNDLKIRMGDRYYRYYGDEQLQSVEAYRERDSHEGKKAPKSDAKGEETTWMHRRNTNYGTAQQPRITYFSGSRPGEKETETDKHG